MIHNTLNKTDTAENKGFKFPIGTTYIPRGKKYTCEVIDHLTSRFSNGDIYRLRYVVKYTFNGQQMIDTDVPETTILRAKWQP